MKHELCRNCGQKTTGLYCSNCGQKNDVGRLKWASLADNFLSTFVGDGAIGETRSNVRYGFLFTIWMVAVHPAQTISEFLEGHRRKYFNPVTILLLLSGFYALIGVFAGFFNDTPSESTTRLGEYANMLMTYSRSHPAMVYLCVLPFTALAYKWIFRKRSDLKYIEYAYVGIFGAIYSITLLFVELPFKAAPLEPFQSYVYCLTFIAQGWFAVSVYRKLFNVSAKRAIWNWLLVLAISYTLTILTLTVLFIAVIMIYYTFDLEGFRGTAEHLFSDKDPDAVHDVVKGVQDALTEGADSLRTK